MCGLVGYLTKERQLGADRRVKFITQALVADTLRGEDGTGVFSVPHEGIVGDRARWAKQVVDGYRFIQRNKDFPDLILKGMTQHAFIGHNRAATIGGTTIDATHPFQEGPITLVHNGTLYDTSVLPNIDDRAAVNDSHAIAMAMAATEDPKEVINKLAGAFALIWHDARDNKIRAVRNSERPLHLATTASQDTVFIASEALMLDWLMTRLKMPVKTMVYPKPGQLLTFDHGSIEPKVEEVSLFTRAVSRGGSRYYRCADDDKYWDEYMKRNNVARNNAANAAANAKQQGQGFPPAKKHVTPSGKARSANRVVIGGREREVPECAQEALLEFNYLVEDRYDFEYEYSMPARSGKVNVVGYIPETGDTAIIHGISEKVITPARRAQTWIIRPIGAKATCLKGGDGSVIICKLMSMDAENSSMSRTKRKMHESPKSLAEEVREEQSIDDLVEASGLNFPEEDEQYVLGPRNFYIPESSFIKYAQSGCICCGANIHPSEAEEVVWVNGEQDPLCPACVEDEMDMVNTNVSN